jgi:hypothetical protein
MYYNDCERSAALNNDCRRNSAPQPAKQVALSASTGGAGPLPIITTLLADPISVVSTSIDTTGIANAIALVTFTGIVSLPLGISVTLNFQIRRSIDDGAAVKVGSTYTFSTLVNILEAEAFSFQFADVDLKPGFYTYSVELSTNSIIDITPGLTINNATLSVLAVNNA